MYIRCALFYTRKKKDVFLLKYTHTSKSLQNLTNKKNLLLFTFIPASASFDHICIWPSKTTFVFQLTFAVALNAY